MEELVSLVVKKTGLPKETARNVVNIVLDFLKKKLPPAVGSTIDGFLSGKGQAASAADMLSGFFNPTQKSSKKK
jgi:hypothetical protein